MRRYFLTGCTGWLGKSIVAELLRLPDTDHVCLLTRDPARANHLRAMDKRVSLYVGDVTTCLLPSPEFTDIIHGANGAYHDPLPLESYYAAVEGTRRVLEWACENEIRSILLLSSGAAATADGTYGRAKLTAEMLLRADAPFAKIARIYALIGDGVPEHYAVGRFIADVLSHQKVTVKGGRNVIRSYLHVEDCARWLTTILDNGTSLYPYDVGGAAPYDILEVAEMVGSVFQVPVETVPGEFPPQTYLPNLTASVSLGCKNTIDLQTALERIRDTTHQRSVPDLRNPDLQPAGAS
jgi:nucleoside-diphosphate-sugar epimerase